MTKFLLISLLTILTIVLFNTQSVLAEDSKYSLSGDFRYRYQTEKVEPKSERPLQRLQAKLTINGKVQNDLNVTMQWLTDTKATSGNQTLGDEKAPGMPRRYFGLNLAYFDYKPTEQIDIYGGRMVQPIQFVGKNQLIFDRDITPEGLALKSSSALSEDLTLGLTFGSFIIREMYDATLGEDQTDKMINELQLSLKGKIDVFTILCGVNKIGFTGLKDTQPNYIFGDGKNISDGTEDKFARGNTVDPLRNYPTNFDLNSKFIEVKGKIPEWGELSAYIDLINNEDADSLNSAHVYGLTYELNQMTLGISTLKVEKDAVVGATTDSDFAGGETSGSGKIYSFNYKLSSKSNFTWTFYDNTMQIDSLTPKKYQRTHFDFSMSF
jgi:hypothetical protein